MTSELIEVKEQEPDIEYPYLAQSKETGNVVLFTSHRTGVLVALGDEPIYELGHYDVQWYDEPNYWTPLPKGTQIKLTQ